MRRMRGKINRDINNQRNISHFSGVPFFCSLVASFEAMCIKLPHKQMQQTQKKKPHTEKVESFGPILQGKTEKSFQANRKNVEKLQREAFKAAKVAKSMVHGKCAARPHLKYYFYCERGLKKFPAWRKNHTHIHAGSGQKQTKLNVFPSNVC